MLWHHDRVAGLQLDVLLQTLAPRHVRVSELVAFLLAVDGAQDDDVVFVGVLEESAPLRSGISAVSQRIGSGDHLTGDEHFEAILSRDRTLGSVTRRDATRFRLQRLRAEAGGADIPTNGVNQPPGRTVTSPLISLPEMDGKNFFRTDEEALRHSGIRRHDRGVRRGTILRMDRARQGNHAERERGNK
jgi:hypothetical protein